MTYAEQIKSPMWQKKRLEILKRDNFICQSCGDEESQLHVHHKSSEYGKYIYEYENNVLITLCKNCHELISNNKKEIKKIIDEDFTDINNIN